MAGVAAAAAAFSNEAQDEDAADLLFPKGKVFLSEGGEEGLNWHVNSFLKCGDDGDSECGFWFNEIVNLYGQQSLKMRKHYLSQKLVCCWSTEVSRTRIRRMSRLCPRCSTKQGSTVPGLAN